MAKAIIEATDLTKRFGDFTAVDAISFEVLEGEIFGFLGANGAGKTTAMKMLCGLLLPTSGLASVAGFDVYRQSEKIKLNIGYMSQKFSLFSDLTVWENIEFYAGIYRMPAKAIKTAGEKLLQKLELESQKRRLIGALPLGIRQKLAFSIAIIHQPRLVFLDEPTGGVDPLTRRLFWEMIYEATERGITVFVTTHYMDEAEYCDRVTMMVDGKIKGLDSPARLKAQFGKSTMFDVFLQLAREKEQ
jgi:ABC-2 type transport system ATP-binding protein